MAKGKPTQRDVALAANVSQSLVSLVLNQVETEASEATRIRILETAKRLGYVPKKKHVYEPKKAKRPGKQGKLLAYIPQTVTREVPMDARIYDGYEEFYQRFQSAVAEAAHLNGFALMVRPYTNPTELTSWLIEWGIDAVIMHSSDRNLSEWISKRYPMVQINRRNVVEADVVMPNQEEMITLPLDYLHQHGHERIAFLSIPRDNDIHRRRRQAYLDWTRRKNLPAYPEFLACDGGSLTTLLEMKENRPTAAIAGDAMALILQKEAIKRGFSLPEDLSIIGIDNISADVFATPPLTSIDVRANEITRIALSLLTERLKEPTLAFQKVEITPKLIVRESVATLQKKNAPARSDRNLLSGS
ncbi:MAG TPA: LacI family DNA-binding transcriptional regulator [Chthoniobacteraceae bacterium]|nr:LacI family DNA-binding transcriptional regulator [Chthoniobacteraceae bacterium]